MREASRNYAPPDKRMQQTSAPPSPTVACL
jgi:hypothetical protein